MYIKVNPEVVGTHVTAINTAVQQLLDHLDGIGRTVLNPNLMAEGLDRTASVDAYHELAKYVTGLIDSHSQLGQAFNNHTNTMIEADGSLASQVGR